MVLFPAPLLLTFVAFSSLPALALASSDFSSHSPSASAFESQSQSHSRSRRSPVDVYQRQLTLDTQALVEAGYLVDAEHGHANANQSAKVKRDAAGAIYGAQTTVQPNVFRYGTDKVRGVNIGGWLVAEPFITPEFFQAANRANPLIVDEWTFNQYQPVATRRAAYYKHWATYYTEQDFIDIKAAGLNHVRIPVGYWAISIVAGEPFIPGSLYWLNQGIKWAGKHGLKVLIDLHGAPGSQNGYDHSGKRGAANWPYGNNVARTKSILLALATEYAKLQYKDVVTALEPLNEPTAWIPDVQKAMFDYYYAGYGIVRRHGQSHPSSLLYTIHDGFMGPDFWKGFMPYTSGFANVALDIHKYTIFSPDSYALDDAARISLYCSMGPSFVASNQNLWTIVTEWAPAPTDCGQKIPGVYYSADQTAPLPISQGSRWDGTIPGYTAAGSCDGKSGSSSTFSTEYKVSLRKFFEVQTTVYEQGSGWIMWTWKAAAEDWSYKAGLAGGWIPRDPTEKRYGNQC